jgi:hypothetical protein
MPFLVSGLSKIAHIGGVGRAYAYTTHNIGAIEPLVCALADQSTCPQFSVAAS